MTGLEQLVNNTIRTGALATVATTLTVAACGDAENGNALAPINAVSHILWGDEAAAQEAATAKYTLTGLALNSAAVTSWAAVHELLFGGSNRSDLCGALLSGTCVSALAYITDYMIVPERLTPGFEKRLSNRSMFGIYAVLAVALAVGHQMGEHGERSGQA